MLVYVSPWCPGRHNCTASNRCSSDVKQNIATLNASVCHVGINFVVDKDDIIESQAVIVDIRVLRSHGRKLQQIADALTERGLPTKTRRSNGWSHQSVARILKRA